GRRSLFPSMLAVTLAQPAVAAPRNELPACPDGVSSVVEEVPKPCPLLIFPAFNRRSPCASAGLLAL
ncbi:hypothetical protein AK812_SmicGene45882, partial [Symbiodinium microadriaticum]